MTEEAMKRSQIFRNAGAPEGVLVFNYAQAKVKLPAADTIPTLVNESVMAGLTKDDPDPFFSVQAIRYPATGNGLRYGSIGIYEASFFSSFINRTKEGPIPGSKFGHEWTPKPSNDFYMVGGMTVPDAGDKKAGVAYFKMYIPPRGYTTENSGFIRDVRAGLGQYSLVTKPQYTIKTNPDGVEEYHLTGSLGSERNDAVEDGAMQQVVNSPNAFDFALARELIAEGKFDRDTKIEGSPLQNGKVYRSALRQIVSRANGSDGAEVAELISLIDKSKNGGKSVNKEDIFAALKNMVANAQTSLGEIANAIGLGALVKNAQDDANEATLKALNAKLGDKPIERLDAILAENAVAQAAVVEKAVEAVAGPRLSKNAKNEDVANPAHAYAAKACNGLKGDALTAAVEALKTDPVIVALNAQRADGESGMNKLLANDRASQDDSGDGVPTTRIRG